MSLLQTFDLIVLVTKISAAKDDKWIIWSQAMTQ